MTGTFRVGTRIVAGLSALQTTDDELAHLGVSRVAVVADRGLAAAGGLEAIIDAAGIRERIVATYLADVDPPSGPLEAAAQTVAKAGAEGIVGIGGGSALSAAKAVALLLANDAPLLQMEGVGKAARPPAPVVAIPTTAGSGSEVSNALVIHEPGQVREIVVRGEGYEPRVAVLDALPLRGLPRAPLLFAAIDALSHSFESLWARGATIFTQACAVAAATEIIDTLPGVVDGVDDGRNADGANDGALQRLLEASSLANLACGNSGLALVHALSSAPSIDLPHGLQNGVLLPYVATFNRGFVTSEVARLITALPALYDRLQFDPHFNGASVDAEVMVAASRRHVFRDNNVRPSDDDDLRALLHAAGATSSYPTALGAREAR